MSTVFPRNYTSGVYDVSVSRGGEEWGGGRNLRGGSHCNFEGGGKNAGGLTVNPQTQTPGLYCFNLSLRGGLY